MAGLVRDLGREAFWRGVLKRFSSDGLSIRAFCRRERLTESAFFFWRRTIRERDANRGTQAKRRPMPAFLPAVVTNEPQRESGVAIELSGGRVLRLPEAMSVCRIAELVHAIDARAER